LFVNLNLKIKMKVEKKELKIPVDLKTFIVYLRGHKYLVFEYKVGWKFIFIPHFLVLEKEERILYLTLIDNLDKKNEFDKLINTIETQIYILNKKYRKKLSLKGLGFRMRVIENTDQLKENILELKVGYSHLKLLRFPLDIKVKIVKKTRIIIESANKVKLGNFAKEVWSTRKPDSYKGKGFWFKYEKMKLKGIKKK